jgi:protein PhnA
MKFCYQNNYRLTLQANRNKILMETKDSNGNILAEGDSVLLIKSLKVKGFAKDLKMGTVVKNIRLTDDNEAIEGKVDGTTLVLKTCFVKKR